MAKKKSKIKSNSFEDTILICACGNPEHNLMIKYNEKLNSAYCEIHLNKLKLFDRIKNGIAYIFNKESKYGDYEEFIIDERHVDVLISLANQLKKQNN